MHRQNCLHPSRRVDDRVTRSQIAILTPAIRGQNQGVVGQRLSSPCCRKNERVTARVTVGNPNLFFAVERISKKQHSLAALKRPVTAGDRRSIITTFPRQGKAKRQPSFAPCHDDHKNDGHWRRNQPGSRNQRHGYHAKQDQYRENVRVRDSIAQWRRPPLDRTAGLICHDNSPIVPDAPAHAFKLHPSCED